MTIQVIQDIGVCLVLDLVVRYQGDIADITGRYHNVSRRAVHVLKPFKEAGVLQGNHPYQLVIHLLDHRGAQYHLAAQSRVLTHLFVSQFLGQTLVHNGELV